MPERQQLLEEARRRLENPDVRSRQGREQTRQAVAFVDSLGQDVTPDLAEAAARARSLLSDAERRADETVEADVSDRRLTGGMFSPAQWLDDIGVFLGLFNELSTAAGERLISDLRRLAIDGDPRAVRRLEELLETEDVGEGVRRRVINILNEVTHETMGQPTVPGRLDGADDPLATPDAGSDARFEQQVQQMMDRDPNLPRQRAEELVRSMPEFAGDGFDEDPLVGVPADHTFTDQASQQRFARQQAAGIDGGGARQPHREPMFRESDVQMPFGWSTEQVAQLQRQMAKAGLLSNDQIRYGWFDGPTRQGFTQLLGFSNQRAQGLWSTLDQLQVEFAEQRDQMRDDAMASFQAEPYLAPDPDALRQRARRNLLEIGRRPSEISEAEIQQMTSVLSGEFKRAHQMRQEAARRQHGAQVAGQFTLPGEQAPTADLSDLEEVDPLASFSEWFASPEGFGGEIETRETSAEVARRGQTFEQGLNQMRSMVRQGGA